MPNQDYVYFSAVEVSRRVDRTTELYQAFNVGSNKPIPYRHSPNNLRNYAKLENGVIVEMTRIQKNPISEEELSRMPDLKFIGMGRFDHSELIIPDLKAECYPLDEITY